MSFALRVSRPDFSAGLFVNAMQEVHVKRKVGPRLTELDLRDTGLREIASQAVIISGCFARKTQFNMKPLFVEVVLKSADVDQRTQGDEREPDCRGSEFGGGKKKTENISTQQQ